MQALLRATLIAQKASFRLYDCASLVILSELYVSLQEAAHICACEAAFEWPRYVRRDAPIHGWTSLARSLYYRNMYEKSGSALTMLFAILSSSKTFVEGCDGNC